MQEVATFKAEVKALSLRRARETARRTQSGLNSAFLLSARFWDAQDFTYKVSRWLFADNKAVLAVQRIPNLVRYIVSARSFTMSRDDLRPSQEWKSYANGNDERDSRIESEVMELADFFGITNRPQALQVLPFLGIFRVERDSRFGFIFQPPPYIENIDHEDENDRGISKPRLPQTLLERINKATIDAEPTILPLGVRFNLARKLARSLYVMHAAGWVHKKLVRSDVATRILADWICIEAFGRPQSYSCRPNHHMKGFHQPVVNWISKTLIYVDSFTLGQAKMRPLGKGSIDDYGRISSII